MPSPLVSAAHQCSSNAACVPCPEQLGLQALGHSSLIQTQSAESPAVCQPTTLLPLACRLWACTLGWVQRLTTHVCRMMTIPALLHPASTLSIFCSTRRKRHHPLLSTITSVVTGCDRDPGGEAKRTVPAIQETEGRASGAVTPKRELGNHLAG